MSADTNGERLARSLIATEETTVSRAWCLADLEDALRRCDTVAERADVARATILIYVMRGPQPEKTPAAPVRRERRNSDRPRPTRPTIRVPDSGRRQKRS